MVGNRFSRSFVNDWMVLRTAPDRGFKAVRHTRWTNVAGPAEEQKQGIQRARGPHQKAQP